MDRRNATDMTARTPIALTIAGSDSGGGAGIQADLRTFAALGVFGASAITSLTAQNTRGVRAIHLAPPEIVVAQIEAALDDFSVAAIKIGMLGSAGIAQAVAARLTLPSLGPAPATPKSPLPQSRSRAGRLSTPYAAEGGRAQCGRMRAFVVYDPVMTASSGNSLSGAGFVAAVRARLLPLVDCLTPNLAEAALLLGEPIARSEADMERQGRALLALGPRAALMKGGHLKGDQAVDLLISAGAVHRFAAPRLSSGNLHGSGCTLSSAVAAYWILGLSLSEAVGAAKRFAREAIERGRGLALGGGPGPLIQVDLCRRG